MPLTLQNLINNGLLDELANCFQSETDANILLTSIIFPASHRPNPKLVENWLDYWYKVCVKIEAGVVTGGFEPLLSIAGTRLPGNRHFAPFIVGIRAGATPTERLSRALTALSEQYDVFLSFSSQDRALVQDIAHSLRNVGLHPWFDEWALPFGQPMVKEIEQILSSVKTVAIFYGTSGYGPWQRAEADIAIERALRGDCLLIPVMLPGVSPAELPPFLRRLRGIRVTTALRLDQANAIDQLIQAIRANH